MRNELEKSLEKSKARAKARKRINAYLGLLVSLLCIFWLIRSVEIDKIIVHLRNLEPTNLIIVLSLTVFSYLLRSWRWPYFFASPSVLTFSDSLRCLILGFFMNNVLPARMGEFVRAHLGGRVTNLSRAHVLATIAGERLADGITISLLFAVIFTLGSNGEDLANGKEIFYVAAIFLVACIITAIILFFRHKLFEFLERLNKIMPGNLSTYSLERIRLFIEGLEPLYRPSRLLLVSLMSLIVWSVELLAYYFVSRTYGYHLNLAALSLFLAAVNFSSLIPAVPGGIGVIEMFATVALVQIGIDREAALTMVATQHLIQILVVGLPGTFYFVRIGGRLPQRDLDDEKPEFDLQVESFVDISEPRPSEITELRKEYDFPGKLATDRLSQVEISIVIPAYNEENRLPRALLSVLEYFSALNRQFEVIVVDDGSTDDTTLVVRQFAELSPEVRLLSLPRNRGKGYAVRFGVMNSHGQIILFCDADGATPIEEFARLENAIAAGADIAIGSRAMYSSDTSVDALWYRKFLGRTFNAVVNLVALPGIADTQCGFKAFKHNVATYIFSRQVAEGFSFDVEILFLARRAHCKIAEVSVNWHNVPGSKVNLVTDSFSMLIDIMKVRLRDIFGGYGRAPDFSKENNERKQEYVS